MNTFEINRVLEQKYSVNICCLDCQEEFSTELDTDYSFQDLPYNNDETLYCNSCEKPFEYTIKIDYDKIYLIFKNEEIYGILEHSEQVDEEIFNVTTFTSVINFYFLEIDRLKELLEIDNKEYIVNQTLNRLLFSGVITNLEIYLNETLKLIVFYSEHTKQLFIEKYQPYKKEQISLNEIFTKFQRIDERINDDLDNIIYHNISKVIRIFNIFNFELNKCSSINSIGKNIQKRHNLVHRNGLDQYNNFQEVTIKEIIDLITDTNSIINYINKKIEEKCYYQEFDFLDF